MVVFGCPLTIAAVQSSESRLDARARLMSLLHTLVSAFAVAAFLANNEKRYRLAAAANGMTELTVGECFSVFHSPYLIMEFINRNLLKNSRHWTASLNISH